MSVLCCLIVSISSGPHGLYSPPGFSVHGISQARILEWLPFPSPGDLPDPGIVLHLLHWKADSLPLCYLGAPTMFPNTALSPSSVFPTCFLGSLFRHHLISTLQLCCEVNVNIITILQLKKKRLKDTNECQNKEWTPLWLHHVCS